MTQKQIGLNLAGLVALIVLLAGWYWQSTGARAVPALTGSLADERAKVRVMAATALAEIGPAASAAAPALLDQALRDSNLNASATAAGALAKIDLTAARQVMSASLPQLASGDADARRRACEVLASLGPVARPAVPRLVEASRDPDEVGAGPRGRRSRQHRLAHRAGGSGADRRARRSGLGRPLHGRLAVLLRAGARGGDPGPDDAARRRREERRKPRRARAGCRPAGPDGERAGAGDDAADGLEPGAAPGPPAREAGPWRAADAVPALVPILREPRALDRYLAAEALGAIGPAAAAARPALETALRDEEAVVRESAAWALEAVGGPRASEHAKAPR